MCNGMSSFATAPFVSDVSDLWVVPIDNVRSIGMTPGDVDAQLRIAGVASVAQIGAVVLETTGEVSVLMSKRIDEELLTDVSGRPAVR
jgi:uncharacterized membrane protein YcaP (DUF421 family)